jgi:hypothetical protein
MLDSCENGKEPVGAVKGRQEVFLTTWVLDSQEGLRSVELASWMHYTGIRLDIVRGECIWYTQSYIYWFCSVFSLLVIFIRVLADHLVYDFEYLSLESNLELFEYQTYY